VVDQAVVDYKVNNDQVKPRSWYTISGKRCGRIHLPPLENFVRVRTDELSAGIYFYTLYVETKG
jgi:hypothetical protein